MQASIPQNVPQKETDRTFLKRALYLIAGILSFTAGMIGVVLPLLPTTPLVLLAAWCFARSNKKFHTWMVTHPRFGKVISDWEKHKGMTAANKRRAYVLIALSFAFSICMAPLLWVKLLLVPIGCCVTLHIAKMNTVSAPSSGKN